MMIRADVDPGYFRRFLYIALACLAFAAWCFYDALVAYPLEQVRSEAYWTNNAARPGEYTAMEREPWRTLVREKGWLADPPEKPDVMANKIRSQFFYAGICIVIALPLLLKWWMARGSWIEADANGLKTSWGPAFQFDQITGIDKAKWEKKGIIRIRYEADGRPGQFAFDDFKFRREPMGKILRNVEETLTNEQITGGGREPEPKADPGQLNQRIDQADATA